MLKINGWEVKEDQGTWELFYNDKLFKTSNSGLDMEMELINFIQALITPVKHILH